MIGRCVLQCVGGECLYLENITVTNGANIPFPLPLPPTSLRRAVGGPMLSGEN